MAAANRVQPNAAEQPAAAQIDLNAIVGRPNFMHWAANIIVKGEERGTIAKAGTYAVAFILALALSVTLIGAYFVGKTISAYSRIHAIRASQAMMQQMQDRVDGAQQEANQAAIRQFLDMGKVGFQKWRNAERQARGLPRMGAE